MTSNSANDENDGLVISAKTVRDEDYEPLLVSHEDLLQASDSMPGVNENDNNGPGSFSISLSPATVTISHHSPLRTGKRVANYQPRSNIRQWSKKSRSAMIARLASLDFSPMLAETYRPPVMITLTYPANWEALVPTADAAKQHLINFKKRYERRFNEPLVALWKMEFQARRAVHFHIFCNPTLRGKELNEWLSETWVEVANEQDPAEREKHLKAGTAIDIAIGFKASDNRQISGYFSKHNSPNSNSKEYQNRPPDLWVNAGSVGRFWGYWHLKPLVVSKQINDEVASFIARTLRNWHRSKSRPSAVYVWRTKSKTGEVRKRKTIRRKKRFSGTSGYIVVNDGSLIGQELARAVKARFGDVTQTEKQAN